ncbi:kelch-like protein 7 [Tubulanus polymorphus]|uniref:kelch-like protein 7 n=1 Tax=Tubulanus polymorphus TaxID=672921 RepID=UPI003DA3CBEF
MAVVRDVGNHDSKFKSSNSDDELCVFVFRDGSQRDSTLQMLQSFRNDKILCDVELLVDNTKILAHRCVLAAFSPYFRAMFCAGMAETFVYQVEMKDINPLSLKQLIDFAYTAEIQIDINNVQELLMTADLLEIDSVKSVCCQFLSKQLHPSNCLGIRVFAKHLGCQQLYHTAHEFSIWCFPYLLLEDELLEMCYPDLKELLYSEEMCIHTPDDLVKLIMEWVKYDLMNRQMNLVYLLNSVDMDRLSESIRSHLHDFLKQQTSEVIPRMCMQRCEKYQQICELNRGKWKEVLMVFGGERCGDSLRSCEVYDGDGWFALMQRPSNSVPQLTQPRSAMSVVQTLKGVYIFGGVNCWELQDSVEFYNSHSNSWHVLPIKLPHTRHGMSATIHDYQIYISGGCDRSLYLNKIDVFDLRCDTWCSKPSMMHHRGQHCSVSLGEFIYIFGGAGGPLAESNEYLNSVERFHPQSNNLRTVREMLTARANFGAVSLNGLIYVSGGENEVTLQSAECYCPATNQWTILPALLNPRRGFSLVSYHSCLFAIGGFDGKNDTNTVEKYHPNNKQWQTVSPMTTSRYNLSAAVVRYPLDKLCHQCRKISS